MNWTKLVDDLEKNNDISMKEASDLRKFYTELEKTGAPAAKAAVKGVKGLISKAMIGLGKHKDTALVLMLTAPAIHAVGQTMTAPLKRKADYDRMVSAFKTRYPSRHNELMKTDDGEKQFQEAFDVVRTFSPKISGSAPVAATAVAEYFTAGGIGSTLLKNLVDIESRAPSTPGHFATSVAGAAADVTGAEVKRQIGRVLELEIS